MIELPPYRLWLGHAGDCRDVGALADVGIEAVVQVAAEEPGVNLLRDMLTFRIPLVDGAENPPARLRLAVESVARLLKDRIPTLVSCSAGASRSPAIAACALAASENQSPNECLRLVQTFHKTDVSPALWADLMRVTSREDGHDG